MIPGARCWSPIEATRRKQVFIRECNSLPVGETTRPLQSMSQRWSASASSCADSWLRSATCDPARWWSTTASAASRISTVPSRVPRATLAAGAQAGRQHADVPDSRLRGRAGAGPDRGRPAPAAVDRGASRGQRRTVPGASGCGRPEPSSAGSADWQGPTWGVPAGRRRAIRDA